MGNSTGRSPGVNGSSVRAESNQKRQEPGGTSRPVPGRRFRRPGASGRATPIAAAAALPAALAGALVLAALFGFGPGASPVFGPGFGSEAGFAARTTFDNGAVFLTPVAVSQSGPDSRPSPGAVAAAAPGSGIEAGVKTDSAPCAAAGCTVRFLAYNIHWGRGADGVYDLDRIAAVLRDVGADVALLTEVDVNWRRSGNVHQPSYLAEAAGYPYWYFGSSLSAWASGGVRLSHYGNLLLSRFPIERAETVPLPRPSGREPRSLLLADVRIGGATVTVAGTHLGLARRERLAQAARLRMLMLGTAQACKSTELAAGVFPAGDEHATGVSRRAGTVAVGTAARGAAKEAAFGVTADATSPARENSSRFTVLMGDFNAHPSSPEMALLTEGDCLTDTHAASAGVEHTFPYPDPWARIDYILVSPDLADRVVFAGPLPLPGSDHLPVVADIAWP